MGRHMGIETQASLCTGEYRKNKRSKVQNSSKYTSLKKEPQGLSP
jgi:hypothetical protein